MPFHTVPLSKIGGIERDAVSPLVEDVGVESNPCHFPLVRKDGATEFLHTFTKMTSELRIMDLFSGDNLRIVCDMSIPIFSY